MTLADVDKILQGEEFTPLDRAMARELSGDPPRPGFRLTVALLSQACDGGHGCLDLKLQIARPPASLFFNSLAEWEQAVRQETATVGAPDEYKPLVLDENGRLYYQRYHQFEARIRDKLVERARGKNPLFPPELLRGDLEKLLPDEPAAAQRLACRTAFAHSLCVITGGPGTGKTFTAGQIVVLFRKYAKGLKKRVALVAPTGKAAARLQESIQKALAQSADDQAPPLAQTIHRFLGASRDGTSFRHGPHHPVPADLIVVDEASMLDLALMDRLLGALRPDAMLILLGDKDQLASVDSGSVMTDICDGLSLADEPASNPLRKCLVQLDRNFRFDGKGGISLLSQAVRRGDSAEACRLVAGAAQDIRLVKLPPRKMLRQKIGEEISPCVLEQMVATTPAEALQKLSRFRVLCALRQGPYGCEQVNSVLEGFLREKQHIKANQRVYSGQPILVTSNDYALRLFNGDLGVVFEDPSTKRLMAWFPSSDGGLRSFAPERLPLHETAFALTVHKSQGSEFDRVVFVLPEVMTPILTRELVYTALTRAKTHAEIWAPMEIFEQSIQTRVSRMTGLRDGLWNG